MLSLLVKLKFTCKFAHWIKSAWFVVDMVMQDTLNNLFYKCVETLKQDHPIRIVNAIQVCHIGRFDMRTVQDTVNVLTSKS